jgi:hypothetical protein
MLMTSSFSLHAASAASTTPSKSHPGTSLSAFAHACASLMKLIPTRASTWFPRSGFANCTHAPAGRGLGVYRSSPGSMRRLWTSLVARSFTQTPASVGFEPEKSRQKNDTYVPMPKDGSKRPLPVTRPVCASTLTFPWLRVCGRSVSSTRMCGASVVFGVTGASGNVIRYRAVWFVVVISVRMPLTSVMSK